MSHVPSQINAAALNMLLELNAELQSGLNLLGRRCDRRVSLKERIEEFEALTGAKLLWSGQ